MIPTFATQALIVMGLFVAACSNDATAPPSAPPAAPPPAAPIAPPPDAAPAPTSAPAARPALPAPPAVPGKGAAVACLISGDGYLRATLGGAVDAHLDWPNSGTRCEGEFRANPPGVRLSFQRAAKAAPNLLLVFGLTAVKEGLSAREVKTNLTVIVQGTSRIFGTLGDSRCTVDSLTQRPLDKPHSFRLEARGFCTQPAHAVRGKGDVLVSTFEFAGPVTYETPASETPAI